MRPNRAAEIRWRSWGSAAFTEATASGRPILLHLTTVWSDLCHRLDETTFSDPSIIDLINASLVPVRVDADRHPHVQDRYIAGGWPTVAFLTPTGEVLWAGTHVDAVQFTEVAASVLGAWDTRREELELEIERRRRAMEASRSRDRTVGLVRREAADDVLSAVRETFDPRNGGFGEKPKFPQPSAIEMLYALMAEDPGLMLLADQTLDGMLAGELWDSTDGGFFRYTLESDWTAPRYEKLLEINAALLATYAYGGWLRDREDWRAIAETTVRWVDTTLALPGGLWGGSQWADDDYFAIAGAGRLDRPAPPVDPTVYADATARWIAALALAGARLARPAWVQAAAAAWPLLVRAVRREDGAILHFHAPDAAPTGELLLSDHLQAGRAALALAQATGDHSWIDEARAIARRLEKAFWAEDGGFHDHARLDPGVAALRHRDRPFEQNAEAARFLLELSSVTGARSWRGLAERTLASAGPLAGRYGVAGADFALAVHEYYELPTSVFVAVPESGGDGGAALRAAAFTTRVPGLRVWTVPSGHALGPQRFIATEAAAAYICTARGCAGPIHAADALAAAL